MVIAPYTRWTALALPEPRPHVYGGSSVEAAIAFRGGYLAVGQVNGGCCDASFSTDTHGVVWRSSDGLSWTLEPRAAVFDLAHLSGLATDGRMVVVVGARMLNSTYYPGEIDPKGAVWRSTDGRTWTRATGMPSFTRIVYADGTFVATTDELIPDQVWTSLDGRSWSPAAGKGLGSGHISDLVSTPAGIIAVGSPGSPDGENPSSASWRSIDGGRYWVRAPAQPSLEGVGMTRVAVSGRTIVALGNGLESAAAWWSTDGLIWTAAGQSPFGISGSSIQGLVAGSRGFVAHALVEGESDSSWIVAASADGGAWTEIETPYRGGGPTNLGGVDRGAGLTVFGNAISQEPGPMPAAWDVR